MALGLAAGAVVMDATAGSRAVVSRSTPIAEAEVELVVAAAELATVSVEAHTCGGLMRGSGFVVSGRLLTSGHLVTGAATMTVAGPVTGATATLPVVGRSDDLDVAFGHLAAGDVAVGDVEGWGGLEVGRRSPDAGEPVVVLARSGGELRWLTATVGVRAPGMAYGVAGEVLLLDRAVGPGWSGGPVLDRHGRVVGMVRGVETTIGLTVVVGMSMIEDWVKSDVMLVESSGCQS